MTGRGRGRARRHAAAAWVLTGSIVLSAIGAAVLPGATRAQEQIDGVWVDPGNGEWTDVGEGVDQVIADVWEGDSGEAWVEPAPVEAAPSYDANGNLIDPATGVALAIGPDGAPIDAAAGLYFDEAGNLIDPATGLAVSWDENGQPILPSAAPEATTEAVDAAAVPEEEVPELVTTPWLAPPPSGPPPGFANWAPPRTVYIPETGQSVDGVFLDSWRAWGGTESWGFPLTPELNENGHIVQYYDFGRFEYVPDDPNGTVVHFGDLGRQTQPFMVRRASGSGSDAANEAALAARAWAPIDTATVRPDSESWRFVPETGHGVAGEFKTYWEATGESGYLGNPLTEPYKIDGVTYQVFERGKLAQRAGESPAIVPIGKLMVERLGLDTTPAPQGDLPAYSEALFTPPPTATVSGVPADPNAEKWVEINITLQYLWAYQGDQVLWQGYISTGTAKFATPPGSYHVLSKLESQTMEGVLGGEYYNVPDVPDVLYFTDRGHAIHGTYWHNNFGTPMSHGCVNLPMDVADWMYQWAPMGMRVEITP
ncbi:MAG: ErfK/YbiS/YcfS/YnhG family protein [Thermomicrobiales bacterium]|jgi:lipoprotein-anchoring transpeptidase ErfK/SrfK|nr:ErfK/YbiS/YcfS/YnhG family protein [Thermomicrobiales bacterium]